MTDSLNARLTPLLAAGAAAGLAVAIFGLIRENRPRPLPADAAARVNETIISNEDYARALERFGRDSQEELSDSDTKWVLDRLIDEELLIQRGLDIGLADSSPAVRNVLVQAIIESVVAEAGAQEVSRDDLREWFANNLLLFTGEPSYRIAAYSFPTEREAARTDTIGDADRLVDARRLEVPDTLLPLRKLRDYVGATATDRVAKLGPGEMTTPFEVNRLWLKIFVIEREPGGLADFDSDIKRIEAEWRRRSSDRALRDYLKKLRRDADVVARPAGT